MGRQLGIGSVTLTWQGGGGGNDNCNVPATACLFFEFSPSGETGPCGEDVDSDKPIPVSVPTGATSVSITASGTWGYNSPYPSSSGADGVGYDGGPTRSDYMASQYRSENMTTCSCNLGSLVGMWFPDSQRATVTISDAAAVEGDQEQFKVTLVPPPGAPSNWSYTVNYATQDGSGTNAAVAGTDYDAASGSLTFSASQTTQTVTVPTHLDGNAGGNLSFSVVLTDPGANNTPPGPGTLKFIHSTGSGIIEKVCGEIAIYNPGRLRRATTARWTLAIRCR